MLAIIASVFVSLGLVRGLSHLPIPPKDLLGSRRAKFFLSITGDNQDSGYWEASENQATMIFFPAGQSDSVYFYGPKPQEGSGDQHFFFTKYGLDNRRPHREYQVEMDGTGKWKPEGGGTLRNILWDLGAVEPHQPAAVAKLKPDLERRANFVSYYVMGPGESMMVSSYIPVNGTLSDSKSWSYPMSDLVTSGTLQRHGFPTNRGELQFLRKLRSHQR